ncbi:MAG: hypothetical protein M3261_00995 [Thermoproteota archaeon]|nr:hypothetical protein [Thermoproteota archaeon]
MVKEQIQVIANSEKLVQGGRFADTGGYFFLLDMDKGRELLQLLGGGLLDSCKVEPDPIIPFDNLFEFFQNNLVRSDEYVIPKTPRLPGLYPKDLVEKSWKFGPSDAALI